MSRTTGSSEMNKKKDSCERSESGLIPFSANGWSTPKRSEGGNPVTDEEKDSCERSESGLIPFSAKHWSTERSEVIQ
ncbi:MAG: hypothetical protein R2813_10065 [Flavobacteriales bacterium]